MSTFALYKGRYGKSKKYYIIWFAILGVAFLIYFVSSSIYGTKKDRNTFNSEICEDADCKIGRWAKVGVEIKGKEIYYFFPEYPLSSEIMDFCDAPSNPTMRGYGSAKVYKLANSNKIYFIVDEDMLVVRMKDYK